MENISYQSGTAVGPGQSQLYQDVTRTIGRYAADPMEIKALGQQLASSYSEFDDGYMKAVLFPEDSEACRIPTKFPLATANAT